MAFLHDYHLTSLSAKKRLCHRETSAVPKAECFWCIFPKFCVKFNNCSLFHVSISTLTKKLFRENCHNFAIYQPIGTKLVLPEKGRSLLSNGGLNMWIALLVTQISFESLNLFVTLCIAIGIAKNEKTPDSVDSKRCQQRILKLLFL